MKLKLKIKFRLQNIYLGIFPHIYLLTIHSIGYTPTTFIKGTVNVILSEHPYTDGNARFTTV